MKKRLKKKIFAKKKSIARRPDMDLAVYHEGRIDNLSGILMPTAEYAKMREHQLKVKKAKQAKRRRRTVAVSCLLLLSFVAFTAFNMFGGTDSFAKYTIDKKITASYSTDGFGVELSSNQTAFTTEEFYPILTVANYTDEETTTKLMKYTLEITNTDFNITYPSNAQQIAGGSKATNKHEVMISKKPAATLSATETIPVKITVTEPYEWTKTINLSYTKQTGYTSVAVYDKVAKNTVITLTNTATFTAPSAFTIDWGDGQLTTGGSGSTVPATFTHTYTAECTPVIQFKGTVIKSLRSGATTSFFGAGVKKVTGALPCQTINSGNADYYLYRLFYNCTKLQEMTATVPALQSGFTSAASYLSETFSGCTALTECSTMPELP